MWDVLLMPLLFTFFGVMVRVAAAAYRNNTGVRPKRIPVLLGTYIPLAIALYFASGYMYQMFNPNGAERYIYRMSGITGKVLYSHWIGFFVPIFAAIGIFLYDRKDAAKDRRVRAGGV